MKNSFKRIGISLIACLLAFAMLLSFVACDDEEDKKDDQTTDEEKENDKDNDKPDDSLKGDIDVTSAEKVAELINTLLEDSIFDSLDNLVPGTDESIKISDIVGLTSNINVLADNFTVNGEKTDLLDMFVIKDNTLYLCGKDEYGVDNSIAGKLTENGYAIISFSDGFGELLDFGSFAELIEAMESIPKIDIDAIKEALTVKTSDLKMIEEGVWELKSSYIVNALKGIIKALGFEESEGAELPSFEALLNMTMVADLRDLNKHGAVSLELNIPDTVNAKINISNSGFNVAVKLPAAETEVVLDFTMFEEEDADKVVGNLVVKYADTEVVNGNLTVLVKEDSVKADFSLVVAETEITANLSQISKENGDSNLTVDLDVKNAGVEMLSAALEVSTKNNTYDALSQTNVNFSLFSGELSIIANFSNIVAKTGNVETTGKLSVVYDGTEIVKGSLKAYVREDEDELRYDANLLLTIAETEITAEFNQVERSQGHIALSVNASVKVAGEEIFNIKGKFGTSKSDDGTSTNINGDLYVFIFGEDEYGNKETVKLVGKLDATITENSVTVDGSLEVPDGKLEFGLLADALAFSENGKTPFAFSCSVKAFDGIKYYDRSSFALTLTTLEAYAEGKTKYRVTVSMDGSEYAGDITFGGADNFVLPEKEAELLDSYLKLVEKYPEYNAQLEIYNDMVQIYIDEDKADELPESFYIEDKNNPEVGYFFDIYYWDYDVVEFYSEIAIITEDTTCWYEKYDPSNPYGIYEISADKFTVDGTKKTYNDQYITLSLPVDWLALEQHGEDGITYFFKDPTSGSCGMTFYFTSSQYAISRTEAEYLALFTRWGYENVNILSCTNEKMSGYDYTKVVYSYTDEGVEYIGTRYDNVITGFRMYMFSTVYPAAESERFSSVFESVMDSIVLQPC